MLVIGVIIKKVKKSVSLIKIWFGGICWVLSVFWINLRIISIFVNDVIIIRIDGVNVRMVRNIKSCRVDDIFFGFCGLLRFILRFVDVKVIFFFVYIVIKIKSSVDII